MLRISILLGALMSIALPALGQNAPAVDGQVAITSSVLQELKFSTWRGTRGTNIFDPAAGKGTQVYAPLTLDSSADVAGGPLWQFAAKTGYVWSHHGTRGQEGTFEGLTDSQLLASVTLRGFTFVQPTAGLTVNVPTGESVLLGRKRFTRMDPDLVELGAYGEGLNANSYLGFTFAPSSNIAISPSVGYALRGKFDREGDGTLFARDAIMEVTPGNAVTASLNGVAKLDGTAVQGSIAFVSSSEVRKNDIPFAQQGLGYNANLAVTQRLADRLDLQLNGSWAFNEKSKIKGIAGGLVDEPKNANRHMLIGSVQPTFMVGNGLKLGVNYSYLLRTENYYDIIEEKFVSAKTKHSAGFVVEQALGAKGTIGFTASRFWIDQDLGPLLQTSQTTRNLNGAVLSETKANLPPAMSFTGWTGGLTASLKF